MNKQQKIIAGGIAFTVAVLSITAGYIPYQAKKQVDEGDRPKVVSPVQRGSMWKHMDDRIKQNSDPTKSE